MLESDKVLLTLPMYYSYGLSVINSHLLVGACMVLTDYSMVNREFWDVLKQQEITSFAGVPYQYETIMRLRFTQMELPTLRYFTQAGGRLNPSLVTRLVDFSLQNDKQFFVMYGQTEATARISYLAPNDIKRYFKFFVILNSFLNDFIGFSCSFFLNFGAKNATILPFK